MDGLLSLLIGASYDETMVRCVALIAILICVNSIFALIGNFNK